MAEFCLDCNRQNDIEFSDFEGLCEPGETIEVLCEGCGIITVDHEGKIVNDKE